MIGKSHGSGAMFGALIVSGIYVILVSGVFSKVANLFPSIVTGSVITTIGLTLIPVAIGNMGNNVDKPTAQSLFLAAITVLIILLVNIFTKGFIKSISILIGLIVGTAIAASMGLVDFSPVAAAPIVHVPTPFYFGMPKFELSSIIMMCIIATVSMVESTGVYLALSDFVSIQGMQILARVDFANNEHNFLIAAVSIAAGVGLNGSNLFNNLPTAFQMFFSNGIVVASLLAIVLNAILNHNKKEK